MKHYSIAASILSADFARLAEEVDAVLQAGADMIHFDVMDNHYVPNLTFGPILCKAIRQHASQAIIDVHLMVENVDSLIPAFAEAGANIITFHPEASQHVDRSLQLIHDHNAKAGLAFNPSTSLNYLKYVLEKIDMILIMSVNPGFGGQTFIDTAYEKIREARLLIDMSRRPISLEVDGGVKIDNIAKIAKAGADTLVAGSAIFHSKDYKATIGAMRKQLEKLSKK